MRSAQPAPQRLYEGPTMALTWVEVRFKRRRKVFMENNFEDHQGWTNEVFQCEDGSNLFQIVHFKGEEREPVIEVEKRESVGVRPKDDPQVVFLT